MKPPNSDSRHVTTLLVRWREGDNRAGDELLDTVYSELRRLAAHYIRQECPDHTLQATALVHELYIRLVASEPVNWQNRAHFFAVAAQQLRRILVNYARDKQAQKRGGKRVKLALSDVSDISESRNQDVLAVDEALRHLEELDGRAARVVELRFFGGLTEREAAEALGISVATLKRDWDFARAWLVRHLSPGLAG
jgi:RNA polymerase sigma factor (TIGR02999 family)